MLNSCLAAPSKSSTAGMTFLFSFIKFSIFNPF
jgi:hypothetical protein